MAVQHRNLPDSELHEPKGAATAVTNTMYISDGSGSGTWKRVPSTGLQGINDGSTNNRRVVTDGGGGFKLIPDGVFGQVAYNAGSAVRHNLAPYGVVTAQNVTPVAGYRFRVIYSGYYRLTFTGNVIQTDPEVPLNYNGFLTYDGTTKLGKQATSDVVATMEYIGFLTSSTEVYPVLLDGGVGSNEAFTRNGSFTIELLGS